jgi:hypothetical protein
MVRLGHSLLVSSAHRWTGPMLTAAGAIDRAADALQRTRPPLSIRDRVLWKAQESGAEWPYPPLVQEPDSTVLRPPLIFATAHVGSMLALGALLERLPAEVLVVHASFPIRPTMHMYSVAGATEAERVGAFRRAVLTLRAGGFALMAVDGGGRRRVHAEICGRRVRLAAGAFALARLTGAPIRPVAAHWRGQRIELDLGPAILPSTEAAMAMEFGAWLEQHVRRYPGDCENFLRFLRAYPLADPLEQNAPEQLVTDLAVLGPGDGPPGQHVDAARGKPQAGVDGSGDLLGNLTG